MSTDLIEKPSVYNLCIQILRCIKLCRLLWGHVQVITFYDTQSVLRFEGRHKVGAVDTSKQRWDQVIALQVTSKSQVFALKSRVKTGKSYALSFESFRVI